MCFDENKARNMQAKATISISKKGIFREIIVIYENFEDIYLKS